MSIHLKTGTQAAVRVNSMESGGQRYSTLISLYFPVTFFAGNLISDNLGPLE